jgi:type I restriction enzyme M protein
VDRPDHLSMADIARLAGVRPPAVSNWRRRHRDFPQPDDASGQETFLVADVANWLSRRKISRNDLQPGESVGGTYGDRFRRNISTLKTLSVTGEHIADDDPAKSTTTGAESVGRSPEAQAEILWRELEEVRGSADLADYQYLVLSMLHLAITDTTFWKALARLARSRHGSGLGVLLQDAFRREAPVPGADNLLWGGRLRHMEEHRFARVVDAIDRFDALRSAEVGQATGTPGAVAFRFLLDRFAAAAGKRGGEFFTPDSPVRLAVGLTAPTRGRQVYDPACRSGGFLVGAAIHAEQHGCDPRDLQIFGQEINLATWQLAKLNLAVHGIMADLGSDPTNALIHNIHAGRRFDVVLANPPFNMSGWVGSGDSARDVRWRYGVPPHHNANFAWLQHAVAMLAEQGRAAVLMANSAASTQNPQERAIRTAMINDGVVESIVALPPQLFYSTAIPVTLWLLRPPDGGSAGHILFVDARAAGKMVSRTRRVLTDDDIGQLISIYQDWRASPPTAPYRGVEGLARSAPLEEIRQRDYVLNPGRYVAPPAARPDLDRTARIVRELQQELDWLRSWAADVDAHVDQQLGRIGPWKR